MPFTLVSFFVTVHFYRKNRAINTMFDYNFVDPDLGFVIFLKKEGEIEKEMQEKDFKIGY